MDRIEQSHRELADRIEQSHRELRAEIRLSHQQLMRALINHSHPEHGGAPVFSEPPDTELIAADD